MPAQQENIGSMTSGHSTGAKKRRAEVKERIQSRILSTSLELFRNQGFVKTSVSDLCKEADVSSATLYKYFTSKEALFGACIEALQRNAIDSHPPKKRVIQFLEDVSRAELSYIVIPASQEQASKMLKEFVSIT